MKQEAHSASAHPRAQYRCFIVIYLSICDLFLAVQNRLRSENREALNS